MAVIKIKIFVPEIANVLLAHAVLLAASRAIISGTFPRASAAAIGGHTEFPTMRTCSVFVRRRPSAPRSIT
jgi:hypothetical protein